MLEINKDCFYRELEFAQSKASGIFLLEVHEGDRGGPTHIPVYHPHDGAISILKENNFNQIEIKGPSPDGRKWIFAKKETWLPESKIDS